MGRSSRLYILVSMVLTTITIWPSAAQVRLEYRHQEGDQWHLTSEVTEDVLIDGQPQYRADILNKISVEVRRGDGGDGLIWTGYSIAEYREDSGVYAWSGDFEAEYGRDVRGRISGLEATSVIPAVRNVPVYPDREVVPGDSWSEPGTEVSDLNPVFGIPIIMAIEFDAAYTYEGSLETDGRKLEKITIEYGFDWSPDAAALNVLQQYAFYPTGIEGRFRQVVLFDAAVGRNYAEEGTFSHAYRMNDGHTYTFRGTSRGQAVYVDDLDREALVEEIKGLGQDDITAEIVDEGVKISLENINFYPDEAVMLPGQEEKLRGILDVLRRYPDRDIQVVGHTARIAGGSDGQLLSEQRAGTVARLLLDSDVRTRDRLTIRGMGNRRPIGDNSTEEGRRLNRRVEIIILEN